MIKVTGADGIKYIIDGERYWPEESLKEALGCKDDDIFGEIKKLKEERDQLKEKCDKLKKRANAVYGASCGYSGDKAPAFLCNVISYSWSFGAIDTPFPNNPIRVELNLTPTANYKGTFDLEDLKHYIQDYGREKKLGVLESVDYANAKVARAELAHLYKTILGKEKLDRDLSPHEIMKAIHDEYKRVRDSRCDFLPCESPSLSAVFLRKEFKQFCEQHKVAPLAGGGSVRDWIQYIFKELVEYRTLANNNFNKAEGFREEKRAVEDSLAELRAKIREIYRSVVDDEWDEHLSYTSALNDINEEYKRVVHNFEERTADWSKAQQELDRYRLAVNSLLDIPKETRDDINAIERAFTFSKKQYESLQEFRNDVCEMFDIPSNMADNYVLKEIHDVVDRYDELEDFRADICGALDIEGMMGTPQQNDKYILEQVEKMKGDGCDSEKEFLDGVKQRIGVSADCSDSKYMLRLLDIKLDHSSLSAFTDSVYEELGISRYGCTLSEAVDELKKRLDRSARLRSNICTALCLGHEDCDGNIIGRIHMMQDCHEKLCKDYTELRKAIWEAMGKISETQPGDDERLVGEVAELKHGEKLLIEFRDDVAKAIGIEYPAANNVILNNVKYICKDRKDAYDMVAKLNDYVTALEKAREDLQQMLKDILGIDSCEKDTVVSAIKALKSAYNSLRNDYDEVCEGYEKLKKDYEKAKCNTNYFVEFEKSCRERQAFIVKLCEALDIDTEDIGSFFDDEETAILKAIEEHHEATASIDQLRQKWHDRYESEHERANGVQKALDREREKCRIKDISLETAKKQYEKVCGNLETAECALNGMKNKVRSLQEEKTKVISALGQDIWDDCLK